MYKALCSMTLALILLGTSPSYAQIITAAATTATTGLVLDQLEQSAQNTIDSATRSGDYLLVRAGIEARIAIENAREASKDVLNVAFGKIDKTLHDAISGIDSTLSQTRAGVMSALQAVQKIQEGGQQIASVIDIQGNRTYITRYYPSTFYQRNLTAQPYIIVVRGVNLDEGDASLIIGDVSLKPISTTKQTISFEIPSNAVQFKPEISSKLSATLNFKTIQAGWIGRLFGAKENVQRNLVFLVLPTQLAKYQYSPTVQKINQERIRVDYWLPQFKGVNADQSLAIAARPTYKIDLGTLGSQQVGDGGGSSYCIGFSPVNQSEYGVVYVAHTGRINQLGGGSPGYVNCRIWYDLVRDVPYETDDSVAPGKITWSSDKAIKFPPNQTKFSLTVDTFDGRSRIFNAAGDDKFFIVKKESDQIIISPQVPDDLTE